MLIQLHKTKPWYGAGKYFGFKGSGLGIDKVVFQNNSLGDIIQFNIKTKKVPYFISLQEAFDFINKNNYWHQTKKGCWVGIIPFYKLENSLNLKLNLENAKSKSGDN